MSFRTEHPPSLVTEDFPDHREAIESLWKSSDEFREVCTDLLTARALLEGAVRSEKQPDNVRRYEDLIEELRQELLALLSAPLPRKTGKAPRSLPCREDYES